MQLAILKSKNFRPLLLARMSIMIALQAQAVIVGWQIYSLTGDVFLLGLAGLVEAVPAIFCALFAGHFVDRGHPRTIFILCLMALLTNAAALLVFAGGLVLVENTLLVPLIFGGLFISGLARGFVSPCAFTLLYLIIPRTNMPAATAWMSSALQTGAVIGPAAAGLTYGGYGVTVAWCMPVMLLAIALMMVVALKPPTRLPRDAAEKETAWQSIKAGWLYMWRNQVLLSMMAIDMFAVLFGGAVAMLPAFADEVLHVGPQGLGLLRAAPAIGAIIMGLYLATHPMKTISAKRLIYAVTGFGFCMIGFGLSNIFWLSLFFLFLSGVFDSVSVVIRHTLMQLLTPDDMKGRLSSINSMFIISSNEIGAFESGTAARLMGLVPSVVFGGVCTLIVAGITAMVAPKFRRTVVNTQE